MSQPHTNTQLFKWVWPGNATLTYHIPTHDTFSEYDQEMQQSYTNPQNIMWVWPENVTITYHIPTHGTLSEFDQETPHPIHST